MEDNRYYDFVNRLNTTLEEKGMTQRELAEKTGMPEGTISRYCSGKRVPNAMQILTIAKALNVKTDYLIFNKQE